MKNGKLLIGAGALASVVILAGGWFLGASPLLASAAASDQQVAGAQQLNELQSTRLAQLKAVGTNLATLDGQLDDLHAVLPQSTATDDFVARLSALEAATGAKVATMTSGTPVLVGTSTAAAATDSTSTPSGSGAATAAPSTPASTTEAKIDVPGLLSIPLTLTVTGGDGQVRDFLGKLQSEGRFVSIGDLVIGLDSADDNTSRLSITGSLFVLPDAAQ